MTDNDRHCPICSSKDLTFFLKRKDGLPVYLCLFCGVKFISKTDLENHYGPVAKLYEREYFEELGVLGYGNYASSSYRDFLWQRAFTQLVEDVEGKRILDVGCATGMLLQLLTERGAVAEGLDVSEYAVAEAVSKGLNVSNKDVMSLKGEPSYDVVTAFDVIEHMQDINGFLDRVHSLLKRDGTFIFLTPDCGSESALSEKEDWYGFNGSLEHLLYFSTTSLNYIFKKIFGCEPVLFQGSAPEGQGILGFIRKTPSQRDDAVIRLLKSNFSTEFVNEDNVVQVCLLLQKLGDGRYADYAEKYRSYIISRADRREIVPFLTAAENQSGDRAGEDLKEARGSKPELITRSYRDGDEHNIVTLFKEVFGREMTLDEWKWKYKGQGNTRVGSAVIQLQGRGVVGHYGGIPLRMIRDGVEIKGISACDVMIRKKFRSFTRLKKLHNFFVDELFKDSFVMFYGFPNERNLLLPSEKLQLYERIEPIYDVVKEVAFTSGVDRFLYKLFPMSFDDARIDALWDEVGHEFRLAIIRDKAYMKWRYGENRLFRYELWGLGKRWSNKLVGLAVVRREGTEKLFIVDMVFGKKVFLPLLAKVENLACTLGTKKLSFWVPGRFHETLRKKNFSLVPSGATLPRSTHPLTIKKEEIAEKFFYTMGDTDFL